MVGRLPGGGAVRGQRSARHGSLLGAGGRIDPQQRRGQRGEVFWLARTNAGAVVLRLRRTSPRRARRTAQADHADWHRRVVVEKKHRQFVAVIIDHDNHRVLEVLENREKTTVVAYLKKAKEEGLLAHVIEVTCDMWDAYVSAAREAFGEQVIVTIDRFHVMKNFQECLTGARRELQK